MKGEGDEPTEERPSSADPFDKLKQWVALTVTGVWALTFLALLVRPKADPTALISVQAVMMLVAGALWADRIRRRNGSSE